MQSTSAAISARGTQEDLNVTLTAISQLWNAADFLARLPTYDADAAPKGSDTAATRDAAVGPPSGNGLHPGVDSSKYAELLEVLFNALQVRSEQTK